MPVSVGHKLLLNDELDLETSSGRARCCGRDHVGHVSGANGTRSGLEAVTRTARLHHKADGDSGIT